MSEWVHVFFLKGKLVEVLRNKQAWRAGQSGKAVVAKDILSSLLTVALQKTKSIIQLLVTFLVIRAWAYPQKSILDRKLMLKQSWLIEVDSNHLVHFVDTRSDIYTYKKKKNLN